MKDALDLFFELSSEERLDILTALQDKPAKLTQLSGELKLHNQEVSRQLARLIALDLCYRDGEGDYNLTPYAVHILKLVPGFDFMSKHRDYFKTHVTDGLPLEFQLRIGELSKCTPLSDVMAGMDHVRQTICDCSKQIWLIQEQGHISIAECLEDAIKRGAEYRVILPSDIVPSEHYERYIRSWGPGHPLVSAKAERRFLGKISLGITLSENAAQIIFPTIDGKLDYTGFKGSDETTLKWCGDVFRYIWEHASRDMPKRLRKIRGIE